MEFVLKKISRAAINMTCRNLISKSFSHGGGGNQRIIVYFRIAGESPGRFRIRMTNVYCQAKTIFGLGFFFPYLTSFILSITRICFRRFRSHTRSKFTSRIDASIYLYDLYACVGDV